MEAAHGEMAVAARPPLRRVRTDNRPDASLTLTTMAPDVALVSAFFGLKSHTVPGDIAQAALHAFGDLETARRWLRATNPFLGATPAQACERPGGQKMVQDLIAAIIDGTEP